MPSQALAPVRFWIDLGMLGGFRAPCFVGFVGIKVAGGSDEAGSGRLRTRNLASEPWYSQLTQVGIKSLDTAAFILRGESMTRHDKARRALLKHSPMPTNLESCCGGWRLRKQR